MEIILTYVGERIRNFWNSYMKSIPDLSDNENLSTPFIRKCQQFSKNKSIKIKGNFLKNKARFHINFRSRPIFQGYQDTIPLHISIRPENKIIVFNSCKHNNVQSELNKTLPAVDTFKMRIENTGYSFKIFFNGKELINYKHVYDSKCIQYISFDGPSVSLESICMKNQKEIKKNENINKTWEEEWEE